MQSATLAALIPVISVLQLGRIDYAAGLRIQQELVELRKTGRIGDVLLLLEHTPVITLGRNAKAANVLLPPDQLALRGVEVFECDRGGDVTFHGPGQLVGYPIFDLRGYSSSQGIRSQVSGLSSQEKPARKTMGAIDYVRRLEEVLIRTCADFSIATKRVAGLTGVWTEKGSECKIAAIGVHISRSVTSHGFALNVNTDLGYFDLIVPCGITSKPVTSMKKELGREVAIAAVAESIVRNFEIIFGEKSVPVASLDALLENSVGIPMKAPESLRAIRGEEDLYLA
ncbi:MAG TPA: lipoyl(octanoyl) transferase LipB [Terriglobales bacterium]|jgi:lipoyl(octanoyl) transferase|nr:lipoyl(octanoyl) transferase LipB [Terriglobales bacterium]